MSQVLFDYFGDHGALGGSQSGDISILKYNGMRFEQPKLFATTLLKDLNLLMN